METAGYPKDPRCSKCAAFDISVKGDGVCRRRAPVIVGEMMSDTMREPVKFATCWPVVRADSWCMEFIPREDR